MADRHLFIDAYFGGLLTGYCDLELLSPVDLEKQGGAEAHCTGFCRLHQPGRESDPRVKREKPFVVISLKQQALLVDLRIQHQGIYLSPLL